MTALASLHEAYIPTTVKESWEKQAEALPNVERITVKDYPILNSYLQNFEDPDSYLTSAVYYLFTGRLGLWSYSHAGKKLFFCWHPNLEGMVLVFPPVDAHADALLIDLLRILPAPPRGLKLARMKTNYRSETIFQRLKAEKQRPLQVKVLNEEVLDWGYPVRILSTSCVRYGLGKKYKKIRNALTRANKLKIQVRPLSFSKHNQAIRALAHHWAARVSKTREEYAELYETNDALFSLIHSADGLIDGLVFYIGDSLEAISLWDTSNKEEKTANLFINLCNTKINGLAEFVIVNTCNILSQKSIDLLNLGGSETSSLDFFKNKFRPATSIDLVSINVTLDETTDISATDYPIPVAHYA